MKVAIEVFSMIIAITLACILFASIISSNNQNCEARDYYNVVINRIEDSNYNEQVVSDCVADASSHGYTLNVEDITVYEDQPSKYVTLTYYVNLPIFSMFGSDYQKQAVIEGYAR